MPVFKAIITRGKAMEIIKEVRKRLLMMLCMRLKEKIKIEYG